MQAWLVLTVVAVVRPDRKAMEGRHVVGAKQLCQPMEAFHGWLRPRLGRLDSQAAMLDKLRENR